MNIQKLQLNIDDRHGKRVLTLSTDSDNQLKVPFETIIFFILNTKANMILTDDKGEGVEFVPQQSLGDKLYKLGKHEVMV